MKGSGEKGFALVITLLILTVLVVAGLELNRAARVEATLAGNFRDLTQASYIAQSGAEVARALIQQDDPLYDGLDERWAQLETLSSFSFHFFPEGQFTGRITDENSKFNPNMLFEYGNVNTKRRAQLEKLLQLLGHRADWIEALLDWMDLDDQPRTGGAEREYYMSLKKPYPAKNDRLNSPEELLLVRGMDRDILYGKDGKEGLINHITVHSDGKININTASAPVLLSLSPVVDATMVQALLKYRREKVFKTVDDLRNVPGWGTVFPQISSEIGVRSNSFSVEVTGNYRDARSLVQSVIRREGRQTRVVFWKAG
ncbi:MAG TPA: type II secretion system minor pseudopilin GspK [Thermodesulfobacteriota bacterium]|nr:type II secretion system minor pseudopilin GspK [Thermodesulfobacteriota bacterium]